MFLHSGASLHGHEYSKPPSPTVQAFHRRSPLLRSPFSPPLTRSSTAPPRHASPRPRPTCSPEQSTTPPSRTNSLATSEPVVRFQEPVVVEEITIEPMAMAASIASSVMDEDASASEAECGSDVECSPRKTPSQKMRRRRPRPCDNFVLARPAKATKKRLMPQIRPKLLLQIHQLSLDCRPTPVVDVFPAATILGPVVGGRLAARFPRILGVKSRGSELASQDVLLFRSEQYSHGSASDGTTETVPDGDSLSNRELVAVLSPLRREDRTEIVLDDGKVWTAEPLPNGSFEFTHTDGLGVTETARWVRRSIKSPTSPVANDANPRSPSLADQSTPTAPTFGSLANDDYRYTFSLIDPTTRRHPVMATLTRDSLSINQQYARVSSKLNATVKPDSREDDAAGQASVPKFGRLTVPVENGVRNLISVTAVWVTLRLGGIMPAADCLKAQAADPMPVSTRKKATSLPLSPQTPTSPARPALVPRRATSTGAAYMQRRIQMSDASDSERSCCRANAKGRFVLSADFSWLRHSGGQASNFSAESDARPPHSPPPPTTTSSPTWDGASAAPVRKHTRSASGNILVAATERPKNERRVRSECYTTPPVLSPEPDNADLAGLALQVKQPEKEHKAQEQQQPPAEKKWKKLGQWIRRLGR